MSRTASKTKGKRKRVPVRTAIEGTWLVRHPRSGWSYVLVPIAGTKQARKVYTGERYYLPDGALNPAALERAGEVVREARVVGGPSVACKGKLALCELTQRYEAHVEAEKPGSTELVHNRITFDRLRALFPRLPAADFDGPKLLVFRDALATDRRPDGASRLARWTINSRCTRVRACFKWAASRGLVDPAVYVVLQTVEGLSPGRASSAHVRGSRKVTPVHEDVLARVLPELQRIPRAMVELASVTGMRMNEVALLRPCDVDRSREPWTYTPSRSKNQWRGLGRSVRLGPRARALLAPFLVRPSCSFCFSPKESMREFLEARSARRTSPPTAGRVAHPESRARAVDACGDRYDTSAVRRAIQRAAARAGVDGFGCHQIRHLRATLAREVGGVEVAGAVLGDRDVTTVSKYTQTIADQRAATYAEAHG